LENFIIRSDYKISRADIDLKYKFSEIAVNEANYFNSGMVVNEAKVLS